MTSRTSIEKTQLRKSSFKALPSREEIYDKRRKGLESIRKSKTEDLLLKKRASQTHKKLDNKSILTSSATSLVVSDNSQSK